MKLFEKTRINKWHLEDGETYSFSRIHVLGIPVLEYIKKGKRRKYSFPSKRRNRPYPEQTAIYLKVNRWHETSFMCIQQWVSIAATIGAYCYIICDNKKLKSEICKNVLFPNDIYSFISSNRISLVTLVNKIISIKRWINTSYAHLTPFWHASANGIKCHWNIDGDDIILLVNINEVARVLKQAEEYANNHDVHCFGLDMFVSRTYGVHWSFGVTYVRKPNECLKIIENNADWKHDYARHKKFNIDYLKSTNLNLDWFFTYLRDTKQLKVKAFYADNLAVCHMPDRLLSLYGAYIGEWKNGELHFPILLNVLKNKRRGLLPIFKNCVKIDADIKESALQEFLNMSFPEAPEMSEVYEIAEKRLKYAKDKTV